MSIRILFFASLREITGTESLDWPWPEPGGTVQELVDQLKGRYAGLGDWDASLLVAADCEYVGREAKIAPGQEVAIMPPVQGG